MSTTAQGGYTNSHAAMDTLAAALVNLLANELEYTRYGYAAVDAAGSGDLTLDTTTEEPYSVLNVTGVLTGARNLIVSTDAGRRWIIINGTSGAFALTVKTSGGTGIAVTQGYTALVGGDGTNIIRLTPDISGSLIVLSQITDTNGNELVKFTATASAINELTIANAATGNHPTISATGGGTNINIKLTPKGTGFVDASSGGIATKQSVANVHDTTPTDAELDAAFGTPATLGRGFVATIDDADGDTNGYLVWCSDASWYWLKGTKAL